MSSPEHQPSTSTDSDFDTAPLNQDQTAARERHRIRQKLHALLLQEHAATKAARVQAQEEQRAVHQATHEAKMRDQQVQKAARQAAHAARMQAQEDKRAARQTAHSARMQRQQEEKAVRSSVQSTKHSDPAQ
ncbi:hypothetical protein BC939DRAFT_532859 [Gamsiella multidivaricata]|uniref:uncharacterized protein n=1 Tax=Gamsiella multidivaricata TaxID=101098 RepID=UPI00221EE8C1|nr:uncharacterized protein BC939DRAFT_532859 [Gamsiella multidivaricata]KAG0368215.1 hypothetical protein BGZ54_002453 [Gamsiella multidivaricata]KAI7817311.1 hypothetical protein BC939DRAFT_532859 [Gamsiella multidivaricata]